MTAMLRLILLEISTAIDRPIMPPPIMTTSKLLITLPQQWSFR
jgi:hypothetical protein